MIPRGHLDRVAADAGTTKTALTVLSGTNDPLRVDNHTGHAAGAWLAERLTEMGFDLDPAAVDRQRIHLRGIHYRLLGARKPPHIVTGAPGEPYTNTVEDWVWLTGTAAKAARWLGYVPFDAIADERNAEPVVYRWSRPEPEPTVTAGAWVPPASSFEPTVGLDGFGGVQPYHLVMIGEKSSLETVLAPIARQYSADLYLPSGEASDTMIYQLARSGAADGRRMRVFYFADCDPGGWQMPISVAHKLAIFAEHGFAGLDVQLYRAALVPDQVRELGLPSAPMKVTERRADKWSAATGTEQTEIDALLATPGVLAGLALDALDRFHDRGLDDRVYDAERGWQADATRALADHLAGTESTGILDEIEQARDRLADLDRQLRDAVGAVPLPPVPELPEGVASADYGEPLLDTSRGFIQQSRVLQRSKRYEP
jgi:hypothetical protein